MAVLNLAQVVQLVREAFALAEAQRSALEARIKHFARLGLPARRGVGRGFRSTFSADDVMLVATALQLVDMGMSSTLAVKIVLSESDQIRALMAKSGHERVLLLRPGGLAAMKGAGRSGKRSWGTATVVNRLQPLPVLDGPGGGAVIVLDPFTVAERLASCWHTLAASPAGFPAS